MNFDSKTQIALLVMLLLARYKGKLPKPTTELATELNISESYLQQVSRRLLAHGLIKSRRGPYGGYLLNKPAEYISVGEVIRIMVTSRAKLAKSQSEETNIWNTLFCNLIDYLDNYSIKTFAVIHDNILKQDLMRRSNDYYLSRLII